MAELELGAKRPLARYLTLDNPMLAGGLAGLLGLAAGILAIFGLSSYGGGLFLAVPVAEGLLAALLFSWNRPRTPVECAKVACVAGMFTLSGFLIMGLEGLICLVMSIPLAFPLAFLGSRLGYLLQARRWRLPWRAVVLLLTVASAPLLMGAEAAVDSRPPLIAVRTAVEVDAPPAVVWRNVVEFSELPPPREWLFRTGIAYPIRAEIRGTGVGAVRHCVFSTGAFVEPITVWDEPRRLAFTVAENPPVMRELSPYPEIHPPHVEGFLVSRRGQFRLVELEGGRTLLEGTTWYQHDLAPAFYWQLWSDWILHSIHRRVLEHVRDLSEGTAAVEGQTVKL